MKLIKDLGMEYATTKSKHKTRFGVYECSTCKKHFRTATKRVNHMKQENCHSCSATARSTRHGDVGTELYNKWTAIKQRCLNKNNSAYHYYGGRGITIYDGWMSYPAFRDWAKENGYSEDLQIDRINNDRGYMPDNCRFVSSSINSQNTRLLRENNTSGYRGVSFNNERDKWQAEIQLDNKRVYLGRFSNRVDGAKAYNQYIIDNKLEHPLNTI